MIGVGIRRMMARRQRDGEGREGRGDRVLGIRGPMGAAALVVLVLVALVMTVSLGRGVGGVLAPVAARVGGRRHVWKQESVSACFCSLISFHTCSTARRYIQMMHTHARKEERRAVPRRSSID